jgi:hypothetical protein
VTPPAVDRLSCARWLAILAVVYAFTHHVGVTMAWLGSVGETRWADWIDLLTPYAVLGAAGAALVAGGAGRRSWALFAVGAVTFVEGHGIHLAANSVGNVTSSDVQHFWDEYAGHHIWYAGVALVFASLGLALARLPAVGGLAPVVLAFLTGLTFTTNALEGQTAVMGIAVAAGFSLWGWRTRQSLGRLMLVAFGSALVMLVGFGVWQGGFPEPTELGWI